jgi:hypothetical protein
LIFAAFAPPRPLLSDLDDAIAVAVQRGHVGGAAGDDRVSASPTQRRCGGAGTRERKI